MFVIDIMLDLSDSEVCSNLYDIMILSSMLITAYSIDATERLFMINIVQNFWQNLVEYR